jgi:hypothetical protein
MRGRGVYLVSVVSCMGLIAAACGGNSLTVIEGGDGGATTRVDAGHAATIPDATVTPACIPGQSVACVGPGGCSTNQVCNGDGSGYGPCDCSLPTDANTVLCVPGQSIACAGAGGCISSQVCNDAGAGYGACACEGDGGTLLCVPGQSIACGGPYGCASFQVCNESGTGYAPCDCPEGGTFDYEDGGLPDGYAPLPPPVGDQGYNAIWVATYQWPGPPAVPVGGLFLPLFSAPGCSIVPPYGECYAVQFEGTGPVGSFPACSQTSAGPTPCYEPTLILWEGATDFESVAGGIYTLSAFNAAGIATGQMNTAEGIVPLVVKNCQ